MKTLAGRKAGLPCYAAIAWSTELTRSMWVFKPVILISSVTVGWQAASISLPLALSMSIRNVTSEPMQGRVDKVDLAHVDHKTHAPGLLTVLLEHGEHLVGLEVGEHRAVDV